MPSLALGKLLSSNNTKTNGAHDASSKKPRVRSLSEKRLNDASQVAKLPTPPNIDRFTSDSYFAAAKKRTPKDGNYNETDDYGFPVVDRLHLQQIADDMQELSKTMLKGKCRTCNKAFQAPAMSVWTCDQCYTANGISSGASRGDMDRPVKPLSASKTQDTIDQLIEHGLKTLESMKPDGLEVPGSPQNSHGDWERPSRRSALGPTRPPGPLTQRRGSAPDISRPNLQFQNGTTDGRPSIEGRPKQAIRRKSPGPISFQGGRGPRSSTHGSPVIGPANGFNGEPPSPFLNSESCSPKFPSESFPRRPRVDMNRDPFQPLLDYLSQISKRPNLNISFSTIRGHHHGRSTGDPNARSANKGSQDTRSSTPPPQISQMDHKDLMIGDVYDVASSLVTEQSSPSKRHMSKPDPLIPNLVSHGSPHIDWRNLGRWYETVLAIGLAKKDQPPANNSGDSSEKPSKTSSAKRAQILEDLGHVVRGHILELMEHLLAIPQQAPSEPQDIRYLLILLANPLLTSSKDYPIRSSRRITLPAAHEASSPNYRQRSPSRGPQRGSHNLSKKSRVLSLLMGVIANLPSDCHTYIIQWLSRYPEDIFRKHVDMLLTFVNERVSIRGLFQKSSRKSLKSSSMYHGVPTSQMFDDLLQSDMLPGKDVNVDDWQLQSACKVLQLFVRANDIFQVKSGMNRLQASSTTRRRPVVKQLIHTEYFYISQLDSEDKLDAARDFDDWERKEPGLQLTRYSFLLTLGTKMRILEADGRKKMASKARQEFFDSIMRHTSVDKFFHLKVRRTCVIEDSLQRISEAISSSEGEAKKALKVHFEGEEGIDAGGLRKEWFLLLVRELLDPALGLFLYNEQTNYCYFNPNSPESSEQYQLVGAVLGLAIYNFTILDVPFPPFLFRKLAAAAPPNMGADLHQGWRPSWRPELSDLAQYDPTLAQNLQQILEYEGNIADDIGVVFQIDSDVYGKVQHYPLVPGGENRIVTKKTREEYVDLYVEFTLDKSIRKQFEPFARGFFNVCGGNALSLFRGEEIELLVRGSGDLDFSVLRGSVLYENWKTGDDEPEMTQAVEVEAQFPVVKWFWELMSLAGVDDQRRVLRWITGSDRIPATGIGSLVLRIQCLGNDYDRLPQARTCFNMLQLWNYKSRLSFIRKFWYAVVESEGFGMK